MEAGTCFFSLDDLPLQIMVANVLNRLDAASLASISCSSSRLWEMATCDDLWLPLYLANGAMRGEESGGPYADGNHTNMNKSRSHMSGCFSLSWPSESTAKESTAKVGKPHWYKLYCTRELEKCVECGVPTKYAHRLLESRPRLCEKCEQALPQYGLVSELEAREHYRLDTDDLFELPSIRLRGRRFLLRMTVEAACRRQVVSVPTISARSSLSDGEDLDAECNHNIGPSNTLRAREEACSPARETMEAAKQAMKEKRKAHKREVKAAKREARAVIKEKQPRKHRIFHPKRNRICERENGAAVAPSQHGEKHPSSWVVDHEALGQLSALELVS